MTTYSFTNTTHQGLEVTYVVGSTTLSTLLGSGSSVSFSADSLTAATQSLIDQGYLVTGAAAAAAVESPTAATPLTLVGSHQATVGYRKGQIVFHDATSVYYVALRSSKGATPSTSPLDWRVFGGPSTGSLGSHVADLANPHQVTATQVGAIATSARAAANGVASLDGDTKVPLAQIPSLVTETSVAALLTDKHPINEDAYLDLGGASQVAASDIKAHLASSSNPHSVTAAQVGAIASALLGANNGVATLNGDGDVPTAQLTLAIPTVQTVADIPARDGLTPKQGDTARVTDAGSGVTRTYQYTGAAWLELVAAAPVASVNAKTGAVVLTTTDLAEGTNLYYTAARVTAHAAVAANTAARHSQNTDTTLDLGNPNEVTAAAIRLHLDSTSNPHGVTAAQVGAIAEVADDSTPTLGGELDADGNKIVSLADPTSAQDATTKAYTDTTFLPKLQAFATKAGSYTITSGDSARVIRFTATATATLPNGMASGFQVVIANAGTGATVTVAAAGTLNAKGTTITTKYAAATFTHIGGDVWEGYGELA